jgi:hypothetical protein
MAGRRSAAEAVQVARTVALPGWPMPAQDTVRDPHGLAEAAVRQWLEVHVRQPRWPLGLPSALVARWWAGVATDAGYRALCDDLYGRPLPAEADATRMPRTWAAACHAERLDAHRPAHLPVLFLVDQTLGVPGGSWYTSRCTGRVCRVFPPEVCARHAFAPTRRFTRYRDDSGVTRPT